MANDAVVQAEPSPATVAEIQPQQVLNSLTREQRVEWQKTGKFPEPPKKAEDSTPSETSDSTQEESAPASEAGKENQEKAPKRSNAESRIKELVSEKKRLESELASLKQAKPTTEKAEPSTVKPVEVKVEPAAELKEPEEPQIDKFAEFADYDKAMKSYYRDMAKYESKMAVLDFQKQQSEQRQTQAMMQELEKGRERYKDYDTIAGPVLQTLLSDSQIDSTVKALIGDSPVFVDLLYVIGGDQEAAKDLLKAARSNRSEALRKVVLLEGLIVEELKKGEGREAKRGDDGKFLSPEKKITSAAKPPSEVSGKSTVAGDEVEDAAKRGDFAAYKAAMNARELAAWKSGR